jgi:hypothetical protein
MLSTNFTDYRLYYQVLYNNVNRPWLETRMPVTTDQIGTGAMGYVLNSTNPAVANNTWSMVINTVNATAGDPYKVTVRALQCPLAGCPVPPPPVSCCHVFGFSPLYP